MSQLDHPFKAMSYMLAAQLCFSSNILLLRVSERAEAAARGQDFQLSAWEPMLYRSVAMVVWCCFCLWRRPGETLNRQEKFWLSSRGLAGVLSLSAYYYGVLHIPLGMASLFSNSSPLYVALLAVLIGGEKLSRLRYGSLICGFCGIALVGLGASQGATMIASFDVLIAALSGPLSATAYFSIRQLKRIRNEQIMLSLGIGGLILALIMILIFGLNLPEHAVSQLWLVASVPPALFAQEFLTRAFRSAPASQVAPLQYTGPLFSLLLGWLVLSETIPVVSLFGIGLVLVFGMVVPYLEPYFVSEKRG